MIVTSEKELRPAGDLGCLDCSIIVPNGAARASQLTEAFMISRAFLLWVLICFLTQVHHKILKTS